MRTAPDPTSLRPRDVGELMFLGRGAGAAPTGTAVVGDILEIARNIVSGGRSTGCTCYDSPRLRHHDETHVRYYIVLSVLDESGVLAKLPIWQDDGGNYSSDRKPPRTAEEAERSNAKNVITRAVGTDTNTFCPPLVVTDEQIDRIVDTYRDRTEDERYSRRVGMRSGDEVGRLAAAFDTMAAELEENHRP